MNRRRYSDDRSAPQRFERNRRAPAAAGRGPELGTHRESSYLYSLMNEGCELVFVLQRNEMITGQLAWYDEGCLKVTPVDGSPSLVIPKQSLKYLYELREAQPASRSANEEEGLNGTN